MTLTAVLKGKPSAPKTYKQYFRSLLNCKWSIFDENDIIVQKLLQTGLFDFLNRKIPIFNPNALQYKLYFILAVSLTLDFVKTFFAVVSSVCS